MVARGEVEIGFQQLSELLTIPEISIAGRLPANVQHITLISAAVPANATHPVLAGRVIQTLTSSFAREQLKLAGLDELGQMM